MTDREALKALVAQLERVHRDEQYRAVWSMAQSHLGPYRGPTYSKELSDALKVLGDD